MNPRDPKRRAMQVADKVGVAEPLRATRLTFAPQYVRREMRENELMKSLIGSLLEPDSCCLDVGAHGADVLREMVRCAPLGRHIAYEPLPELHAVLVDEFPMVDVRRAALGRQKGMAAFVRVVDSLGHSGFRKQDYRRTTHATRHP